MTKTFTFGNLTMKPCWSAYFLSLASSDPRSKATKLKTLGFGVPI